MDNDIIKSGYMKMSGSSISICALARDCQKNLKKNIRKIDKLRLHFAESEVVIFENDSKDKSLAILESWAQKSNNVIIKSEKYRDVTIPENSFGANPYYSKSRIEKMSFYRNKYLEIINSNKFSRDYVIVMDLDIADFSIDGIAHSFGVNQDWSCITSNGTSLSKTLKKQYHDTFALVEKGYQALPMTEEVINENRRKFAFMKTGMPLLAVDSAFGGLAIYDWDYLNGKYYSCINNADQRVQVLCEHISLNKQLGGNIFINPNMKIKYRSVTLSFILEQLKKRYKVFNIHIKQLISSFLLC
jgi:glycosyltransferase involved in cell wall biosynthesis